MSVKLSSIICYLYSRSSLDYLKSLINQCNSLESELDETKNKYDEISVYVNILMFRIHTEKQKHY